MTEWHPESDQPAVPAPANAPEPVPAVAVPAVAPPAPVLVPQTSSNAVIALVLAISSWLVCPLALAIVSLVFAHKADQEVAASGGRITGGGLITAAKIVSWVNIGVTAAVVVILAVVAMIAVVAGSLG